MKCKNCGTEFLEGIFCPECGTRMEDNISKSVSEQSNDAVSEKERLAKELAEHELEIERQKIEQVRLEKERIEIELNKKKAELEQAKRTEVLRTKKEEEDIQKKDVSPNHNVEEKIEKEGMVMAALSLVCGIVSLMTMGGLFVPEILGIVFACLGKKQGKMRGLAKAGFICSIISIIILISLIISIIFTDSDETALENERDNSIESYISTVENGYLGEYTDITIDELLGSWYGIYYDETGWDGGTTDDGEIIVDVILASVDIYTGDCSDHILMEATSYGDRYIAEFNGILVHTEGNTYQAKDDICEVIVEVTFEQLGMQVQILQSEFEEFYVFEGYIPKSSEINFNEVG